MIVATREEQAGATNDTVVVLVTMVTRAEDASEMIVVTREEQAGATDDAVVVLVTPHLVTPSMGHRWIAQKLPSRVMGARTPVNGEVS